MVQELCYAASQGDVKYMQTLLIRGARVDQSDYDLRTPLHLAVCENRLDSTAFLIAHGADVHAKDRWGRTPVDEASTLGEEPMMELLSKASNFIEQSP